MKLLDWGLAIAIALCVGGAVFFGLTAMQTPEPPRVPYYGTVLVGTGCEGPSDIAVALEEDMLPRCNSIEIHKVQETY